MPLKVNTLNYSWIFFQLAFVSVLGVSAYTYSGIFTNPSFFPYFGYCAGAAVLAAVSGLILVLHNRPFDINKRPGILLLAIWAAYIAGHGYLSGYLNFRHSYLLLSVLFIMAGFILLSIRRDINIILGGICLLASIEAIWCILQAFGMLPSLNSNFPVSGTWVNPNVSAMYLTLSFPIVLGLYLVQPGIIKHLLLGVIVSIIAALILLKCRTAFIGTSISALVLFNYHYGLVSKFKKASRSARILIFSAALFAIVPIVVNQYNSKKASADGRKLIWKISLQMIADEPVSGYGYGQFEKNYNLRQAAYIQDGNPSAGELKNAGFVKMAYNEFLENTIEGGIIGLLLFGGVLFFLLKSFPKENTQIPSRGQSIEQQIQQKEYVIQAAAYTGILSFAAMSIFNFTIQAIPCMLLFGLYAAICLSAPSENNGRAWRFIALPKPSAIYIGGVFGIVGLIALTGIVNQANAQLGNKNAADLARSGDYAASILLSKKISPQLQQSESFWHNYGKHLMQARKYSNARYALEKARSLTSNPELYFLSGKCCSLLGDYKTAENYYLIAKNIEPSRYKHRIALMKLYLKSGDKAEAILMAREILNLKPKISSEKADEYKAMAGKVLKRFGVSKNPSGYVPEASFQRINYQNRKEKIPD